MQAMKFRAKQNSKYHFLKYQLVGKSIWAQCYSLLLAKMRGSFGCLLAALACHRVWPNAVLTLDMHHEGTKGSKAF